MKIRIATRKSALALWQAEHVAARLLELTTVDDVELVPMSTRGDEVLDRSLQKVGGKGLFIKELEIAIEAGRADIAVHSMKDVPADMPGGFTIAAVLERANHADALVARNGMRLPDLEAGSVVGSSSLRRQAQLLMLRPDLRVESLRGNVNTRLSKLDDGNYDAIVLAAAGLERLGLGDRICQQFTPDEMLPAAAQGVIGIECLASNTALIDVLAELDHDTTVQTTNHERSVAAELQAGCQSPVATYATVSSEIMTVTALVALPDGSESVRERIEGRAGDNLGSRLAARLIDRGAREMLDRAEAMSG